VGHDREVSGIAMDNDENRVVSTSFDGSVKVWDIRTQKCLHTLYGHKERLTRCDVNDHSIASACFDGEVRIWKFNK
jgi:WD40 repeat protein